MTPKDRLDNLYLAWRERAAEGQEIDPVEFCRDCPEFASLLAERIALMRRAEALLGMGTGEEAPEVTGPFHPASRSGGAGFATGDELAGRYRIVSRIGAGGMGVVYRAHDARLEQDVALKLLPERWASDPERLARFRGEVRTARMVSHPNVCRVYDLGEHQGQVFLTMEFVAGDDLRSLLRRVERLPEGRALEVARQLCSAVAAVHDQGLLHRDLKPANVLLDDRGNVRLVDFGIAALAGRVADVRSGTAAYQAPEVLEGREVTVQSDLYALGLVLYEVFTGKQAFSASSRDELVRMQESGPAPPSGHVRGLDPGVERVILCCLQKEPRDRPRNAAWVRATLPGALKAAVAAGETPTPGFVADAGGVGSIPVWYGRTLLAVVLAGLLLSAWLTDNAGLHRRLPLGDPAELRGKARTLVNKLTPPDEPPARDRAEGVLVDHRDLRPAPTPAEWRAMKAGRSGVLFYWYRQSPGRLIHRLSPNDVMGYGIPGMVTVSEPGLASGEVCVILDREGRLLELHARPALGATAAGKRPAVAADWKVLFAAADLDADAFRQDDPVRDPGVFADERAAWVGPHPDHREGDPARLLYVEAAARGGRPVYFWVGERKVEADGTPTSDRAAVSEVPSDLGTQLSEYVYTGLRLLALTVGAWMAWANVRKGVANRTGATRLALVYVVGWLLLWLCLAHHTTSLADEWAILAAAVGGTLINALTMWVIYLALEPSVRRHLPGWMVGWNRLLDGRWRDPAVGRDVLTGSAFGVLWASTMPIRRVLIPEALGQPFVPYPVWMATLTAGPLGPMASYVAWPLFFQLLEFFMLVIVYLASGRRLAVAAVLWGLFWTVRWGLLVSGPVFGVSPGVAAVTLGLSALVTVLAVFTLLRFGLLAFVSFGGVGFSLIDLPITLDRGAWYGMTSVCVLVALAAVALFAYTRATADQGRDSKALHTRVS